MIGADIVESTTSVLIGVVALLLLLQPRVRVPEPLLVAVAAAVGLIAFG